ARGRQPAARPRSRSDRADDRDRDRGRGRRSFRLLEPVLVDVRVNRHAVLEAHEVEPRLWQSGVAVAAGLRVREAALVALDCPDAPLQVTGRAVMALVVARRDAHALPDLETHSRASSSPGLSTPFSVRIVSTE